MRNRKPQERVKAPWKDVSSVVNWNREPSGREGQRGWKSHGRLRGIANRRRKWESPPTGPGQGPCSPAHGRLTRRTGELPTAGHQAN
jgi:hypothetical protein